MSVRCFFNPDHLVVPGGPGVRQMVVGWSKPPDRRAGRFADIVCREERDEWACGTCIELKRQGHNPGQGGLL